METESISVVKSIETLSKDKVGVTSELTFKKNIELAVCYLRQILHIVYFSYSS